MKQLFVIVCAFLLCVIPVVAQPQSSCGSLTLYFQHNESTSPAGYEELIAYPSGNPEVDESITIQSSNGPVLIDAYIMPEGSLAQTSELLRGLRTFLTYHYVSTASGTTQINFTAFQRFANGTEVVFYSQLTDDINALTVTDYTTYRVSQADLIVSPTDRLGIKIYGQTTHPSPVVLHFVYQGSVHASHFESGYFVCPSTQLSASNGAGVDTNTAFMLVLGIVGGIVGAIVITSRKKQ
jgi:hypothetical protein